MFSKISELGAVLNKTELKNTNGAISNIRCKIEIQCPGGFYFDNYSCSCKRIIH